MSEIKDKLITAESLKYVYDNMNNNITELKSDLDELDSQLSESIFEISENVHFTNNILTGCERIYGKFYRWDGEHDLERYDYIKNVKVERGKTYDFNFKARFLIVYKDNGEYVGQFEEATSIEVPSDKDYLLFVTIDTWSYDDIRIAEHGTNFEEILPYGLYYIEHNTVAQNLTDDAKEATVKGRVYDENNLINFDEVVDGYIDEWGYIREGSAYKTTGYIPVFKEHQYIISPRNRKLSFFNARKENIHDEHIDGNRYNYVFTPTEDGYVRFTFYISDTLAIMFANYDEVGDFKLSEKLRLSMRMECKINEIANRATETLYDENNLINFDEVVDGYLEIDDTIIEYPNYRTTGYIPVVKTHQYIITPRIRKLYLYRNDKSCIRASYVNNDASNYVFTPTEDGYVRFTFYIVDESEDGVYLTHNVAIENLKVNEKFHLSQNMKKEVKTIINKGFYENSLYKKKWVVYGDSFSWGGYSPMNVLEDGKYKGSRKTYPYFIGNRTGIEIVDFTMGGRTLAYPEVSGGFSNSLTCQGTPWYYKNIPTDADYITIYLGINDGHHRISTSGGDGEDNTGIIPLGTIDDTTVYTYYGAWNVVIPWILENRPYAHLGIIVSNGVDTEEYRTAQLEIAEKWGIPYIDLNGDERTPMMIRSKNPNISQSAKDIVDRKQAVDYPNNTHPNDEAHEYESYFIENFLRSL